MEESEFAHAVAEIAHRYRLSLVLQFGSTVRGGIHPRSDVDVAVQFETHPPSYEIEARLAGDLQALFPDRDLDLAVLNRADPLLLKKALEECRLLAGSARRLAELRIYAFKRYQDHRRFLDLERAHVSRVVRELRLR